MNAIAAAKSPAQNRLEGFALAAILHGFPNVGDSLVNLSDLDGSVGAETRGHLPEPA
jgi:hypothetical protein